VDAGHGDRSLSTARFARSIVEKLVVAPRLNPVAREQYRKLAAGFHHAQAETGLKVIMVASALSGEGKTITAVNLSLTFSESYGRRVLLVDADLRDPSLHELFGLPNSWGLAELLSTETPGSPFAIGPRLSLLAAGTPTGDPLMALGSHGLRRFIEEARAAFDWIVLDTPPLALLSDAHLLTSVVDSTVLVVAAGSTPYAMVQQAADAIGQERLAGVVLNRAQFLPAARYYDGDRYGD
jgi:capsular exopolysaccharide synthesis family protein